MKKLFIIILVAAILLAAAETGHTENIVISTFDFKSPNLDVAERVMTEAYRRIGAVMTVRRMPGERAILTANGGMQDGELIRRGGMSQTYPNLIMIPVPVVIVDFVVFAKERNFEVSGWESLIPYRVGYRRGVKTVETNLAAGTKSEAVTTLEQAFGKLRVGRTDVVVDTRLGGLVKLNQLGIRDIVVLEPPLTVSPQFHYLHVKNRQLSKPLTAVLRQMEKEGVIQDILRQVIQDLQTTS